MSPPDISASNILLSEKTNLENLCTRQWFQNNNYKHIQETQRGYKQMPEQWQWKHKETVEQNNKHSWRHENRI